MGVIASPESGSLHKVSVSLEVGKSQIGHTVGIVAQVASVPHRLEAEFNSALMAQDLPVVSP